jgi:pimeloyl-ACP methyl ester carboxylesterase
VETKKSLDKAPPAYSYFDSTKVRYELYVPPEYDAGKSYPFVLFIPSETRPNGWSAWQKVCRDQGIIFASPHNCGDDRPLWERSRSALDVFDEVRRQYHTDPDRTYLAGSGGGARVACRLGFSLPEVCGGIVALGSCDLLRDEPWLRRRVVDRLNVALVASNAETSKAELERFFGPLLEKLTIRSRVWVEPGMSKNLPEAERLSDIYQWLETGVAQRRDLAARYPGSRMPGNAAWSRPEWSAALLAEAKLRLEKPETVLSGIGQLAGVKDRWSDVPAGLEALGLFQDYYQHKRELVQEEARERLGQDSVLARSLTAYLTGTADRLELARSEWQWERYLQWIQLASDLWNRIEIQGGNSDEAKAALEKLDEVRRGPRPAPTP